MSNPSIPPQARISHTMPSLRNSSAKSDFSLYCFPGILSSSMPSCLQFSKRWLAKKVRKQTKIRSFPYPASRSHKSYFLMPCARFVGGNLTCDQISNPWVLSPRFVVWLIAKWPSESSYRAWVPCESERWGCPSHEFCRGRSSYWLSALLSCLPPCVCDGWEVLSRCTYVSSPTHPSVCP